MGTNEIDLDPNGVLFKAGEAGYHSFRIPALVRTYFGTLLAFAEGRRNSDLDYGDIDIVMKSSRTAGKAWTTLQRITTQQWKKSVVFDDRTPPTTSVGQPRYSPRISLDEGTCGNPTVVVDSLHENTWLFFSANDKNHSQQDITAWGQRKVYSTMSENDGLRWSTPIDRTKTLLPRPPRAPDYATWDGMGPGAGVQARTGPRPGRLMIPAYSKIGSDSVGRVIYSDDGGVTWQYQLVQPGTSESAMAERLDGHWFRADRAAAKSFKDQLTQFASLGSPDLLDWGEWKPMVDTQGTAMPARPVQVSLLRYTEEPSRLLFVNPSSTTNRRAMRLRLSMDEGQSWSSGYGLLWPGKTLDQSQGGYSSMAKTRDMRIGVLYEVGRQPDPSGHSIRFLKIRLADVIEAT